MRFSNARASLHAIPLTEYTSGVKVRRRSRQAHYARLQIGRASCSVGHRVTSYVALSSPHGTVRLFTRAPLRQTVLDRRMLMLLLLLLLLIYR